MQTLVEDALDALQSKLLTVAPGDARRPPPGLLPDGARGAGPQPNAGVLAGVPVRCEFDVPPPPAGYEIDVDMIGVTYRTTGGAVAAALTRVDGPAACAAGGWYFDDPGMPTRIELCPEVCRTVQADPDARMDITLGCASLLM